MIDAANATETALLSRRSVRGYLPVPIPRADIEHLLDVAARAPSGTNMQPWQVIALAGDALTTFIAGVSASFTATGIPGSERPYYPTPLPEPWLARRRRIGWDLYALLGIARGETEKMRTHLLRNLAFFGAPVGLICTIDRRLAIGSWLDYGMFLQNIATAARARGLDTCAMAVFAEFPDPIRELLQIGPDHEILCGMAIGHADPADPANALVTERLPAAAFTDFRGFTPASASSEN